MLISKQLVEKACNLTPSELNAAMYAGGYTDKYSSVQFLGMNQSGQFVYQVSGWCNVEGETVTGNVYLNYQREPLSTKFVLKGDY